jgi:hypothetical protein
MPASTALPLMRHEDCALFALSGLKHGARQTSAEWDGDPRAEENFPRRRKSENRARAHSSEKTSAAYSTDI